MVRLVTAWPYPNPAGEDELGVDPVWRLRAPYECERIRRDVVSSQ